MITLKAGDHTLSMTTKHKTLWWSEWSLIWTWSEIISIFKGFLALFQDSWILYFRVFKAAAGTAAAVGTVQNANTNANLESSNRRIDDNKDDIKNLKSTVATTCSRVNYSFP